jgi:hypothetical protein
MFQKIRAFLFGSGGGRSQLSYVERQIDTGKAILEMMDKARVLGVDVHVWIGVEEAKEGATFPADSAAAGDLYKIVSRSLAFWVERYAKEQGGACAERIWREIERKLDQEEKGRDAFRGPRSVGRKVPPKR